MDDKYSDFEEYQNTQKILDKILYNDKETTCQSEPQSPEMKQFFKFLNKQHKERRAQIIKSNQETFSYLNEPNKTPVSLETFTKRMNGYLIKLLNDDSNNTQPLDDKISPLGVSDLSMLKNTAAYYLSQIHNSETL